MSKRFRIKRLGLELSIVTICGAAICFVLFLVLQSASFRMLDYITTNPNMVKKHEVQCIERLQKYVDEKNLSIKDTQEIQHWVIKERNIMMTLYRDGKVVYTSEKDLILVPSDKSTAPMKGNEILGSRQYRVDFSDGSTKAVLNYYFENRYYLFANMLSGLIAFAVFMGILFLFIKRKIQYIQLLESELSILKGGDLDYRITLRGNDELTSLAREMNAMRCAIKERQESEIEYQRSSRELVTAMSHDLRTPLTSLIGYIDILYMKKCSDKAQRVKYFEAIRDKAYQIKGMSDKLFEYFIVFGKDEEPLEMQQVNSVEFLGQVVEESLFDLESRGFHVCRDGGEIHGSLMVNVDSIRRVFGNIFSNLVKYADPKSPVQVTYIQQEALLRIRFVNRISDDTLDKESSNMGLKTCEKIMKDHGGTFLYEKKECEFLVELELPIL